MPEPLRPAPAKLFGRRNLIFVPVIASPTGAPTVAEATAASALDVTNILFAEGAPQPSQETNTVEAEARFGDTIQYESIGLTKMKGGQITMQLQPQAAAASDGKKAWEKFAIGGVTGYLMDRMDIPKATAVTAGQFVNTLPIELGPFMPAAQGQGESAEAAMTGTYVITGPCNWLKAVLA